MGAKLPTVDKAASSKTASSTRKPRLSFSSFARAAANFAGKPIAFGLAIASVILWAVTGPMFDYSDTWQLVINTGTTVVTFLMVFLIQNTQNHDTQALQLKLDELIRANEKARNLMIDLEQLDDNQIERLRHIYEEIADHARKRET